MKKVLMTATAAMALAATPAIAQGYGAQSEASTEVQANTNAQGGPYASDRGDASQRYGALDGQAGQQDDLAGARDQAQDKPTVNGTPLTQYEMEQLRKVGPEAVEDVDTLDEDDTSY
ncbi:hypothetical protein [Henriciella aquimarina]|uniref:hypothetical protein n=1 Tax=Henriciella aquimarina TaxID=545261 RepID=UPI0009FDA476|nr:hypothetical protein [Henriciella aquimarina]